jgi:hypothetical protein
LAIASTIRRATIVLYAATQRVSCFIETLARFRPDLSLVAELQEIAGEDDYVPLGTVPSDWCDLLAAIDSATRYTSMQPPSAKLCSHPVQRYAATDWAGQNIIHAEGVLGKISVSLNPVFRELRLWP